jgi:cation:H+ antiporter
MVADFFLFLLSLLVVVRSADRAVIHGTRLARTLRLSSYLIGFIVVAVVSILPETFIAITSALQGNPSFGLGTLFGGNVADLTLVFATVALVSWGGVKIDGAVLKNRAWYLLILALPLLLGFDGAYSRAEGILLMVVGLAFFLWTARSDTHHTKLPFKPSPPGTIPRFLLSMALLLVGAHFTVVYGVSFADGIGVSPILVGLLFVALGTTLPELLFSIRAVQKKDGGLAMGDILGTVIADATVVIGLVAVIQPFSFDVRIVHATGLSMLLAALVLFHVMKTNRVLSKKEALLLILLYVGFVTVELIIG